MSSLDSFGQAIAAPLRALADPTQPLREVASEFWKAMGYSSERTSEIGLDDAIAHFRTSSGGRFTEKHETELRAAVSELHWVFQFAQPDLSESLKGPAASQGLLPMDFADAAPGFELTEIHSYLFVAVALRPDPNRPDPPRGRLVRIAKLINIGLAMPAIVLLRHADAEHASICVIHRRLHKTNSARDVLERKASILRAIRCAAPHRAHLDILHDLTFAKLHADRPFADFRGLHAAWLAALDLQTLNERFYREIRNWFHWARLHAAYPPDAPKDAEGRDSDSILRLLTRTLFCWFLRERGLIPHEILDHRRLSAILRDWTPQPWMHETHPGAEHPPLPADDPGRFHLAILQNLFFATLATPPEDRKFRARDRRNNPTPKDFLDFSKPRHEPMFRDGVFPADLFEPIPFLNGGLFECHDRRTTKQEQENEGRGADYRVDGFSDRETFGKGPHARKPKRPRVPDFLFFADERPEPELAGLFDGKKKRPPTVRGLLRIFSRYKFTIEENTPLEEDIALDPELLGRVFENLLAAIVPETQATARKATGSFYTPRPIVGYMVDEALRAALADRGGDTPVANGAADTPVGKRPAPVRRMGDKNVATTHLRPIPAAALADLFAAADLDDDDLSEGWRDEADKSDPDLRPRLIRRIAALRILDPAVGSGAFPMGALQRLVQLLKVLDHIDETNPDWRRKSLWFQHHETQFREQLDRAAKAQEPDAARATAQKALDDLENYTSGSGRKLFLIRDCLHGVDIQTAAIQIAKLRFFLTLLVEQRADKIEALPNLETKLIAANSLIPLTKGDDWALYRRAPDPATGRSIADIERDLLHARRDHFQASKPAEKLEMRARDATLRTELQRRCAEVGGDIGAQLAAAIARWDPYDLAASAPFFDAETQFGLPAGFHIVIGNPPYGFRNVLTPAEKRYFRRDQGIDFPSGDIAELFAIITLNRFVRDNCILCLIIPKKSLYGQSWRNVRALWRRNGLRLLMDASKAFQNVLLEQAAFCLVKGGKTDNIQVSALDNAKHVVRCLGHFTEQTIFDPIMGNAQIYRGDYLPDMLSKIKEHSVPKTAEYLKVKMGISGATAHLTSEQAGNHPCIKGIDIARYGFKDTPRYLIGSIARAHLPCPCVRKLVAQKIIAHVQNPWPHIKIAIALDDDGKLFNDTAVEIAPVDDKYTLEFLLAYLQSRFVAWFAYNIIYNRAIRTMDFINYYVTQIPLPSITSENAPIVAKIEPLATDILAAKAADPAADTAAQEREVDALVCDLYGLSAAERALVGA